MEQARRLSSGQVEFTRVHHPEPVDYFKRMNRRMFTFITECTAFSRLVVQLATHISRHVAARKIPLSELDITTPRMLHNGGVYFEVFRNGERVLNKIDEIHFGVNDA